MLIGLVAWLDEKFGKAGAYLAVGLFAWGWLGNVWYLVDRFGAESLGSSALRLLGVFIAPLGVIKFWFF